VKTIVGLGPANGLVQKTQGGTGECFKSPNWADWPLVANTQKSGQLDWTYPDGVANEIEPDEWIMLQLYAGRKAYAFNMRHLLKVPEFMERLAHLLCKIGIQWRMHNMSYDLQVIRANDLPEPEDVRDTMLYGLGLTERGEQVGLKALSRSYLNAAYYEKELVESGFKPIFDGKTLNGWDCDPDFWSIKDGAIVSQLMIAAGEPDK